MSRKTTCGALDFRDEPFVNKEIDRRQKHLIPTDQLFDYYMLKLWSSDNQIIRSIDVHGTMKMIWKPALWRLPLSYPTAGPIRFLVPVRFLGLRAHWTAHRSLCLCNFGHNILSDACGLKGYFFFQINSMVPAHDHRIGPGVGVTKALFVNLFVTEIFDLTKVHG